MKIAVETIGFNECTGKAAFSLKEADGKEYSEFEINSNCAYVCYALVETDSTFGKPIMHVEVLDVFESEIDAISLASAASEYLNTNCLKEFTHKGKEYYVYNGWGHTTPFVGIAFATSSNTVFTTRR